MSDTPPATAEPDRGSVAAGPGTQRSTGVKHAPERGRRAPGELPARTRQL